VGDFLQKEGVFRINNNQEKSSDIKKEEISLICENIPLTLRKIFENMAAEFGSLLLKVGEFTCMNKLTTLQVND
jgi:hypothetical protein